MKVQKMMMADEETQRTPLMEGRIEVGLSRFLMGLQGLVGGELAGVDFSAMDVYKSEK